MVDKASKDKVPERDRPEKPVPSFELTATASAISYVRFSGAPVGGYLVCDEVRFDASESPVAGRGSIGRYPLGASVFQPDTWTYPDGLSTSPKEQRRCL